MMLCEDGPYLAGGPRKSVNFYEYPRARSLWLNVSSGSAACDDAPGVMSLSWEDGETTHDDYDMGPGRAMSTPARAPS